MLLAFRSPVELMSSESHTGEESPLGITSRRYIVPLGEPGNSSSNSVQASVDDVVVVSMLETTGPSGVSCNVARIGEELDLA